MSKFFKNFAMKQKFTNLYGAMWVGGNRSKERDRKSVSTQVDIPNF